MKRVVSALLVCVLLVASVFALAACSNISDSYAQKVNKAAEKDEHFTLTQVLDDLGEEAIDFTIAKTGVVIAVKGCKTIDEIGEKLEGDETVYGIVVTFALGKAMSAEYREIDTSDLW